MEGEFNSDMNRSEFDIGNNQTRGNAIEIAAHSNHPSAELPMICTT